jgi:hypothetical protein
MTPLPAATRTVVVSLFAKALADAWRQAHRDSAKPGDESRQKADEKPSFRPEAA